MQTWAKRGMQTALVTGGLLALGTSIAAATENVNPDRPAPPLDGGFAAPTHIGNEEADVPGNTTQALPGEITQVEQVIGTGLAGGIVNTAGSHAGNEWPALSGDLADPPAAGLANTVVHGVPVLGGQPAGSLLRVPLDVVGRAVAHNPAASTDTRPQFGPADSTLLRATQVPVLGDLFRVPNLRTALPGAPLSTLDRAVPALSAVEQTRQLPVVGGLSALLPAQRVAQSNPAIRPAVQDLPVSSDTHYLPMTGDLPAAGQLTGGLPTPALPSVPTLPVGAAPVSANLPTLAKPSLPSVPSLSALPDLPPVPTLPAMPPIPGRPTTHDLPVAPTLPGLPGLATPSLPTPSLTGPSVPSIAQLPPVPALPSVPGRPATHDLPAVSTPSLFTPTIPAVPALPQVQDVPAGSAQQLMAQLRNLITDLENSASGSPNRMHPMQGLGDIQPPAL